MIEPQHGSSMIRGMKTVLRIYTVVHSRPNVRISQPRDELFAEKH